MGELEKLNETLARILVELEKLTAAHGKKSSNDGHDDEKNEPVVNKGELLKGYMQKCGIEVLEYTLFEDINQTLIFSAYNIGYFFCEMDMILKRIKESLKSGNVITINLKDYSQNAITGMCSTFSGMKKLAFLEYYEYKRAPHYILKIKPNPHSKSVAFFNGKWLEYFTAKVVARALREHGYDQNVFVNVKGKMPNGDIFEWDILTQIGGELFSVECKTGDYQRYIEKYVNRAKIMHVPAEHRFLIVAGIDNEAMTGLNDIYDIKVCDTKNFECTFGDALPNIEESCGKQESDNM